MSVSKIMILQQFFCVSKSPITIMLIKKTTTTQWNYCPKRYRCSFHAKSYNSRSAVVTRLNLWRKHAFLKLHLSYCMLRSMPSCAYSQTVKQLYKI